MLVKRGSACLLRILQSQSEVESQRALLAYLQGCSSSPLDGTTRGSAESRQPPYYCSTHKSSLSAYVTEDALADQKEALNRLLGRDFWRSSPSKWFPLRWPEESSLQQARKVATEMRPEIKAETIKKERAALDTKIERTR